MLHVDPEYRIKIALAGREYMVPWGYFSSRPTPARFNCAPLTAVSLQFWIPDLAAPEGIFMLSASQTGPLKRNGHYLEATKASFSGVRTLLSRWETGTKMP